MKRSPTPPADVTTPAPMVPTFGPHDPIGRLATAYSRAIDRALAAEKEFDRLHETGPAERAEKFERSQWQRAMDAFDRAESALFEAMKEHGLRAVIVEDRLFMDIQSEEDYIPDRPQRVSWQTFRTD